MSRHLCYLLTLLAFAGQVRAGADAILVNGKIVRFAAVPAEAVAVQNGRIAALGSSKDMRALAGPGTRVIDLSGRTVIPGLIDSHIHAIRAGLTYESEVHWTGAHTIAEALGRIRAAARITPKGSWLVVAGGEGDRLRIRNSSCSKEQSASSSDVSRPLST